MRLSLGQFFIYLFIYFYLFYIMYSLLQHKNLHAALAMA